MDHLFPTGFREACCLAGEGAHTASREVHGVCILSALASVSPLCDLAHRILVSLDFRSSVNHACFAGLMGGLNWIIM